jgi:hypothetical protein
MGEIKPAYIENFLTVPASLQPFCIWGLIPLHLGVVRNCD